MNDWNPSVGEDWDVTPPVFWVSDGGDPAHADYCTYRVDDQNGTLSFNASKVRWELPIDENYVGKTIYYACYYGSTQVFDGNYTIQGQTVQPAAPSGGISGGGFISTKKTAFPVFPEHRNVGPYIYSVYHASGSAPTTVFKDVYIANGKLCFVPRVSASHKVTYYAVDIPAFPAREEDVKALIGTLKPEQIRSVKVEKVGSSYCIPLSGSAMIQDVVSGSANGEYWFIVMSTEKVAVGINTAFIALIAFVLVAFIIYSRARGV